MKVSKIAPALVLFWVLFFVSVSVFAEPHVIKLKIHNPNTENNCDGKWCQVYVEIPAKLYMDKGWLREDLRNLRFNDGYRDLSYWVIPKKDDNYRINKLGLWLLVWDLDPGETQFIDMIIDDSGDISHCNPRASDKSEDRSSYLCAATVFPFYAYNLGDWKFLKSNNDYTYPDVKFENWVLYKPDTIWPAKYYGDAKTENEFTLHIDNMKFYEPYGWYYSEAIIYFLLQSQSNPPNLESSSGYRLYIKKASDFDDVSDNYHYTRKHFVIYLQKRVSYVWTDEAKTDWYPYHNTRHVFDIKVSKEKIALYINGKHFKFERINGSVDTDGNYIRSDSFDGGFFGFDRKGWRLCCGTDINYIVLRNYFKKEPEFEVYGNTDLLLGKDGSSFAGEDVIEIVPAVQRLDIDSLPGNTLDRYLFSQIYMARENQIVDDLKLKIKNRGKSQATFKIIQEKVAMFPNDWLVYWCNSEGLDCSLDPPSEIEIGGASEVVYVLKIFPSPEILFNGGRLELKIKAECEEDLSWDIVEFDLNVTPKLVCYWKYKMPVTVSWNPAHGYNTLQNYQVLVETNSIVELSGARSDGSDIIVTDSFGNIVSFWLKQFDSLNKELKLWVRVPQIRAGDNTIYVWWGNPNFVSSLSNIHDTFDLFEDWKDYAVAQPVGCPDGTPQCNDIALDLHGWQNIPTPDDDYNWWIIRELPEGNKLLQADIYRDGNAIDRHNGLCGYSDFSGKSCDTGPYIFNGEMSWDHYEIYYKINAGPYCQYSGCGQPWGNPQYNPVFVIDAGNMWGMEYFADKFIFRPYASGIDYVWQYQTYPREILGENFPKRNEWYWVKVRVFKDRETGEAYLRLKIAKDAPSDIDKDEGFYTVGNFTAPPVFSLPYGKIGFGGWDSGFYFDDIRVRKYVEGADGKEPQCTAGSVETLTPREKITLYQPQITPPIFNGRAAYLVAETIPFSWRGDLKAFYADCLLAENCDNSTGEDAEKPGTISIFGKIDDDTPKGFGYHLMEAKPGENNRSNVKDESWKTNGRFILTRLPEKSTDDEKSTHDFNGFDHFDSRNCEDLKSFLGVDGSCNATDDYFSPVEKLIRFVRGFYVEDFPRSRGRDMDSIYGDADGVPEDDEQWKLGDILHSNPLIVGIPNMGYGNETYQEFVNGNRDRPLVIYFMSNEGMLHAFEVAEYDNGTTPARYRPLETPVELWTYIPAAVLPRLKDLTGATHHYAADGLLRAVDAYDGTAWRTILLGILGRGGQAVFALDITNPENPRFLWEINASENAILFEKLGQTISAPALGKLTFENEEKWVAVIGSGLSENFLENYTTKKAHLAVIDLFSGKVDKVIKVNDKPGNVLTDITPQRDPVTGELEAIYFGDYYGALWRVTGERLRDLSDNSSLEESDLLFKPYYYDAATNLSEAQRPITARPVVAKGKNDDWWVYFGTGDYDEYDPEYPHQRFYGIKITDSTLADAENCGPDQTSCGDFINLTSSTKTNGVQSWVIELGHNDTADINLDNETSVKDRNERVLNPPEVFAGYVFFTTYQPLNEPCGGGKARFYIVTLYGTGSGGIFENRPENTRSIELETKGIPSKPMIYIGPGKKTLVSTGVVSSTTGELEKISLSSSKLSLNLVDILLWRRVR